MKKIMFVCTGNICRSAMAHYYMQQKVKELKKENDYLISSCGTHAITGDKITENAIKAMKDGYNIDASKHRATSIGDTNIEDYDLILCMTEKQKRDVIYIYPKIASRVYTLKEYVDITKSERYLDIDDPWGYNLNIYNFSLKEITESIDRLLKIY